MPETDVPDVFFIPYNVNGVFVGLDSNELLRLDLTVGAKIKVVDSNSVNYLKTGVIAKKFNTHFTVKFYDNKTKRIGIWWINVAMRGAVKQFPFVNLNPQIVKSEKKK